MKSTIYLTFIATLVAVVDCDGQETRDELGNPSDEVVATRMLIAKLTCKQSCVADMPSTCSSPKSSCKAACSNLELTSSTGEYCTDTPSTDDPTIGAPSDVPGCGASWSPPLCDQRALASTQSQDAGILYQ